MKFEGTRRQLLGLGIGGNSILFLEALASIYAAGSRARGGWVAGIHAEHSWMWISAGLINLLAIAFLIRRYRQTPKNQRV